MKWRQTLLYLVVLLLIGGYFSYFEIWKKGEKEAAEQASRKVFQTQSDAISALEVSRKGEAPVVLKKENAWSIREPVQSDVDRAAMESFLHTLTDLDVEREISANADNLQSFGLQDPSLRIRFQTGPGGDQSQELLVGDSNPVGDGYYAKTSGGNRVFLIAQGSQSVLNKGLNELRKKELFGFEPENVMGLQVTWEGKKTVTVLRQGENAAWTSPDEPTTSIKASKVKNVLEQIRWMRAMKFLENTPQKLVEHGLEPPAVKIRLQLQGNRSLELRLGQKDEATHEVAALSSELPAVVEVGAEILQDLPKDLVALEDRSLLPMEAQSIRQVKWKWGEVTGEVVRLDGDRWGFKKGDQAPVPMKESWEVQSLLWDLNDGEFQKRLDPTPSLPDSPQARVELGDGDKLNTLLVWSHGDATGTLPATVWLERDGSTQAVELSAETIGRLEGDLEKLSKGDAVKK